MSDSPPPKPLSEAEKDEILRTLAPLLRDLRTHLANYDLQTHEVERLGGVVANHQERISVLETQVLAGVYSSSSADPMIPVDVEDAVCRMVTRRYASKGKRQKWPSRPP